MASPTAAVSADTRDKPRLSFWQIWNMSFGFLGIQFGFALQNANVSRIFETLGGTEIALYWLAAPLTGMLVQPIIGYMSDRTWSPKWGRRRPFFLVGAVLASLALLVMPNVTALWMAVGMLWIMDSSINISMEPFRALVGDLLPSEQRTTGFAAQTFFIGVGAVVASALPWMFTNWLGISNTAPAGQIPLSVKYAFYIGGAVFLAAVLWTVFNTKEYPPENLVEFEEEKRRTAGFWNGVRESFAGIFHMPKTMAQLAVVQFFSWLALFSMWIYTTPAVTSHIYHTTDTTSKLYNEGADWVGICFAVYNGVSAIAALLLPLVARRTSRRVTHLLCLVAGGLGLISIYFIQDPNMLLLSMVGVGVAWASILSVPYAMLAGALPANKMGYYMGVFNFFIVIPQVVAGLILGFFTQHVFHGESVYTLVLGGCSMIISGLLTLRVDDADDIRLPAAEQTIQTSSPGYDTTVESDPRL
ncbi:MFS transporter [Hymenobacter actinosclerus]|uniref:Maltose/moltooligosaccharide transporter n=1 Tax=Hymenobacter actinosclerus TaxID=82805 RepID=A0A1I0J3J9_9BACT|nr:MFS transporter [Hymenobacter actinosclerus]SEU03654.1 maltose/moltooligosaccharide transporter [Hymenobacter actinosclerus]